MAKLINASLLWTLLFSHIHYGFTADDDRSASSVYGYRRNNWCVIGKVEPELFEWPFVQFKPFLLKANEGNGKYEDFNELHDPNPLSKDSEQYDEFNVQAQAKDARNEKEIVAPKYTLEFKAMTCSHEQFIGRMDSKGPAVLHNRAHMILKIEFNTTEWEGVEGLMIQGNHAPNGIGFPFGQFDDEDVQCDCAFRFSEVIPCLSRPDLEIIAPTVGIFHYQQLRYFKGSGTNGFPKELREVGKQKEFHFNFKWHHTPCSSAAAVEFWVLVIHDFYRQKYEIKKFGPYTDFGTELYNTDPKAVNSDDANNKLKWKVSKSGATGNIYRYIQQPIFMPSPIFPKCSESIISPPNCVPDSRSSCVEKYFVKCHGTPDYFPQVLEENKAIGRIRINGEFDMKCIMKYKPKVAYKQCPAWTGKAKCFGRYEDLLRMDMISESRSRRIEGEQDPFFADSFCPPCDEESEIESAESELNDPGRSILKRGLHSILMILGFLFFLPLSMILARFYKETFHGWELKGWRQWLWVHVGIGMFLMLMIYTAYVLPEFWELDLHMYFGYGAIFSCLIGFISGWCREKSLKGHKCSTGFHALSGYLAYALALVALWNAQVSDGTRWIALGSVILSILIAVILSIYVRKIDKEMGVKPDRKHWPILQVRFEESYIPGQGCRKLWLLIYTILLLGLILALFFI